MSNDFEDEMMTLTDDEAGDETSNQPGVQPGVQPSEEPAASSAAGSSTNDLPVRDDDDDDDDDEGGGGPRAVKFAKKFTIPLSSSHKKSAEDAVLELTPKLSKFIPEGKTASTMNWNLTTRHFNRDNERNNSNIGSFVLNAANNSEITTKRIHKAMERAHKSDTDVSGSYCLASNYDTMRLGFCLNNLHDMIASIIPSIGSFKLTPCQRLASAMVFQPMPEDIAASIEKEIAIGDPDQGTSCQFEHILSLGISPGCLPKFRFLNYAPGTGKTIIAIAACFSVICDDREWDKFKIAYKITHASSLFDQESGLVERVESVKLCKDLARLVLFQVPEALIDQWTNTLQDAARSAFKLYGKEIVVWSYQARQTKDPSKSLEAALNSGQCVFYVISQETRCRNVVRDHPHINYAICVMDEVTPKSGQRDDPKKFSQPACTLIINATVSNISRVCGVAGHHPLSYVFRGDWRSLSTFRDYDSGCSRLRQAARCCLLTHMFSPPDWLRKMVGKDGVEWMPPGTIVHRMTLQSVRSLQAKLYDSDLVKISLTDLFRLQLASDNYTPDHVFNQKSELIQGADAANERHEEIRKSFVTYLNEWISIRTAEWIASWISSIQKPEYMTDVGFETEKGRLKTAMLSLIDRVIKFRDAALACVDPNEVVEDAITLDDIELADRVIMSCCGKVMSRKAILEILKRGSMGITPKCPLCRHLLRSVKIGSGSVASSSSSSDTTTTPDVYDGLFVDVSLETVQNNLGHLSENDKLRSSIQWFKSKVTQQPGTLEGIAALLRLLANMKHNLRALVIVKEPHRTSNGSKREMIQKFRDRIPSNFNMQLIDGTSRDAGRSRDYKNMSKSGPHILFLFSSEYSSSSTVAGMDLHMTDVTIFESLNGASDQVVQAVGRCLRRKSTKQDTLKHIVILESARLYRRRDFRYDYRGE